jgi:hypothetical protein
MTVENRVVVGLDDIKTILIECKVCHSRISYLPTKPRFIPERCPQCKSSWRPQEGYVEAASTLVFDNFVTGVSKIVESLKDPSVGFRVLFEFDAPTLGGRASG